MKGKNLNYYKTLASPIVSFLLVILMLGCSLNDSDNQSEVDESLIEDYLTTNNINAEKDMTGYYYSVVNENTSGDPIESDDIVSVYYTMTLLDGQEVGGIDPDTDPPAKFKMADKSLIPVGLRYGTSRMKVGEKYRFFIPSNLAYEFYSYDNILPPYSILIVESEVVKIESEETQKLIEKDSIDNFIAATNIEDMLETDSGLYFKRTSDEGSGDVPAPGTSVRIKYSAKYLGGNLFKETGDDETLGFVVGNSTVIEGLQEGVQLMKEGETATIIVPSYLAFDESLQVFPELFREDLLDHDLITEETPPFSILEIAVELVEIL